MQSVDDQQSLPNLGRPRINGSNGGHRGRSYLLIGNIHRRRRVIGALVKEKEYARKSSGGNYGE